MDNTELLRTYSEIWDSVQIDRTNVAAYVNAITGNWHISSTRLAEKLMPVQPLESPTGLIYYLRNVKQPETINWQEEGF